MFEWVGKTIAGGWDAVSNVVSTVGKGASGLVSGFFPTAQKTTTVSEITQSANTLGQTYRVTDPDSPSMFETAQWADQNWLNSPYESQYSIPSITQGSLNTAAQVTAGQSSDFDQGLDQILLGAEYTVGRVEKIASLADTLGSLWQRVSTVFSGQKEIGNSPGTVINVTPPATTGASTTQATNWFSDMASGLATLYDQAKGLFSLGYSQQGTQPAFTIAHEIEPSKSTTTGLIIAGVVILVLFLLLRKKK